MIFLVVFFLIIITTEASTLVVLYGEPRGGPMAWESLKRQVINPLEADLALLFPKGNFTLDYDFDWSDYNVEIPTTMKWERLCDLKYQGVPWSETKIGQTFGKLCPDHYGSAGVLLMERWRAAEKIIDVEYDCYIFTRADYLYLHQHPGCDMDVWVPKGEEYGGWTDRHVMAPKEMIMEVLNVTRDIFSNVDKWLRVIEGNQVMNLEQILRYGWKFTPKQFPPLAITVRSAEDLGPTWSQGVSLEPFKEFGLLVKYPTELELVGSYDRDYLESLYVN